MSTLKVDTVQSTGGSTIFTHSGGLFKPNALICQVTSTNTDQDMSASTTTVVEWQTVDVDTGSYWDSTNHRYTPSVAGWYSVNGIMRFTYDSQPGTFAFFSVRKNGTLVLGYQWQSSGGDVLGSSMLPLPATFVQLNGSGDYIDVAVTLDEAGTLHDNANYPSSLSIQLVHAT